MRARPARALPAGTPGSSRAQRGGQDEELGGAQEQDPGPAPHRDSSAALAWTRRRASHAGAGRSEDAHASAPPPPRLVSLLRPRPSLRPAVPPFPRAPRGAALFSLPPAATGLLSESSDRRRHSFSGRGWILRPCFRIRLAAMESSFPALPLGGRVTGRPRSRRVVAVPANAPRRVTLRGTPLPQGRMGKAGWGRKGAE